MTNRDGYASNNRQAYAKYLAEQEWTHIGALTFRNPVSSSTAWIRLKDWLSEVRSKHKCKISWYAVLEFGEEQERHVHVILKTSPTLSSDSLRSQWRAGISHIQRFDPTKPGIYYLTKTLNRDDAEFDLEIVGEERGISQMKNKTKQAESVDVDQLITVQEASQKLRISTARCYELIRRQTLPAVSLGRQKRISVRALRRFIRKGGKTLSNSR